MTDQTREPTTASDMSADGAKQGNDYGSPGTASEQEGAQPAGGIGGSGGETPWAGASDGGGSGLDQDAGGSDPNGPAVPDEQEAAAAQDGVQEAFSVDPQD
ncbi:MAG TPA: hypothetical protein VNA20_01855 [Frankiaceae bacterium]|nr:hypothetical protein [Frankiaceae bacterium]